MDSINKELLLEILGTLTKLRKDFPYTMLLYVLEPEQALKVCDVLAGTTVTFPTQAELLDCIKFAIVQKYGSYEATPKEVLNGLTKKRYLELLSAYNKSS